RLEGTFRFTFAVPEQVFNDEVEGFATIVLDKGTGVRLDELDVLVPQIEEAPRQRQVQVIEVDTGNVHAGKPVAQEVYRCAAAHAQQQDAAQRGQASCGQGEKIPHAARGRVPGVVLRVQHAVRVQAHAASGAADFVARTAHVATVNDCHARLPSAAFYGRHSG